MPVAARGRLPLYSLIGANAASRMGNVIAAIALPWFVLSTTGSAAKAGLIAFLTTAPLAFGGLFGGTLADRLGTKRASVAADLLSGLTIAAIPLLHTAGALDFWSLAALVVVGGVLDAPGEAARDALLPRLSQRADVSLERANSLATGTEHAAYVLGAPAAGVLIAVIGAPAALWVDAGSFALSALAVGVAVPAVGAAHGVPERYWQELVEGLRFLRGEPVVRVLTTIHAVGNLLISPLGPVILVVYAQQVLDSGQKLAYLLGAYGIGGLAGTFAFAILMRHVQRRALFQTAFIAYPVLFAVLIFQPPLGVLVSALLLLGLFAGAVVPLEQTVTQERTPERMRARVFGFVTAAAMTAGPLGILMAGVLVEAIGLQGTLMAFTASWAALTLAVATAPAVRRLDDSRLA